MIADAPREREAALEPRLVKIVEEDPADSARLVAVLEEEVFVAPALEARMEVSAERVERRLAGAMEMHAVFVEAVVRRQVHAAAEPEHGRFALSGGHEAAHVHVHGGHVGIARMQHERNAHGLESATGEFGAHRARRGREPGAADMRERDAAALEQAAVLDDARVAAATAERRGSAFGALPPVAAERPAVEPFQLGDDPVLQRGQIGADGVGVHGEVTAFVRPGGPASRQVFLPAAANCAARASMARCPMSRRNCMPLNRMASTT